MPYGNRTYSRRKKASGSFKRYGRRKTFYKKRVSRPVKAYVKNTISRNIETKHWEVLASSVTPTYNQNTFIDLAWPIQGIQDFDHIGDRITLKYIHMIFNVSLQGSRQAAYYRIIVVQVKNQYSVGPNVILQNDWNSTKEIVRAPYAWDYKTTYHKLFDKTYSLNSLDLVNVSVGPTDTYRKIHAIKLTKFGNKHIRFEGGTTNPLNGIRVYLISSQSNALGDEAPTIKMSYTIAYKDA